MKNRRSSHLTQPLRARRRILRSGRLLPVLVALAALVLPSMAAAASAPPWMQTQASAPVPEHDPQTAAVLMYSETVLTVQPNGNRRRLERRVFRILRPEGAKRGLAVAIFDSRSRIVSIHGWCIPATGKEFEVKDRDAIETALVGVAGSELISDVRARILSIPDAVPGSLVGYEFERDEQPMLQADSWDFQDTMPVRESRFTVELPPGWQYSSTWINHPVQPPVSGANRWLWVVSDVKPIAIEDQMPPWQGMAGRMWISFVPPSGLAPGPQTWQQMGGWYLDLTSGRRDTSPEIRQKVAELTAAIPQLVGRIRALATFVQSEVRYVAIELGIGGYQPHPAAEVFTHRYGDCKDKATLLASMIKELAVDSSYVIVDTARGAVTATTPPNLGFDHVILAIRLPPGASDPSLQAVLVHPRLGSVLLFDPTDPYTPFGSLSGRLQGGYGLLVVPEGSELVQLPRLTPDANAIRTTAHLTLDASGTLTGDVQEILIGNPAAHQRSVLTTFSQNDSHRKFLESHLGDALSDFQILKATVGNVRANEQPLEWNYSLEAQHYAKASADLLVVRPRVLGSKSSALLETREPRHNPVEFDAAEHDTDMFEIALPPGYRVEELPAPVDADYGFAAYHSRSQLVGHTLRYSRSLEIRELSIPVEKTGDLKELYRTIAGDEHATAVLIPDAVAR
jgi:hypothetical protein